MRRASLLALCLVLHGCDSGTDGDCSDWDRISNVTEPTLRCPKEGGGGSWTPLLLWAQSTDGPVCPSAEGDSACVACTKTSCCGPVVACFEDTSCRARVEGTSDAGADILYDAARSCIADHCAAACGRDQ
jgi:hypothetical protein